MRRCAVRARWPAMVVLCALVLSGCAAIPSSTEPRAVEVDASTNNQQQVQGPSADLDPLQLVREFIRASGDPANGYQTAGQYLTDRARTQWRPEAALTVISDTFNTITPPRTQQPEPAPPPPTAEPSSGEPTASGSASPDTTQREDPPSTSLPPRRAAGQPKVHVQVRGTRRGKLDSDNAYVPQGGALQLGVTVEQRPDGQWRISSPPRGVVMVQSAFRQAFRDVSVYFVDPERGTLVADPRYVLDSPAEGMPARVVDLLLGGPSSSLTAAVDSAWPEGTKTHTNVLAEDDGTVLVDLTLPQGTSVTNEQLAAAQVVLSLRGVSVSRVRLELDGVPLVGQQAVWRPADVSALAAANAPEADLPGLVLAKGRLREIDSGDPVEGPAGSGALDVQSAAVSRDGDRLAVIETAPDGLPRLRIGPMGGPLPLVKVKAREITTPSWSPGANQVWTVLGGTDIAEFSRSSQGRWVSRPVDAGELTRSGKITDLRLSPDGTRVAAVVGGNLTVGTVSGAAGDRSVTSTRVLLDGVLDTAVSVDWQGSGELVIGTADSALPVARVSVDGQQLMPYSISNLTPPIAAVAAAAGRPILASDQTGLWSSSATNDVWELAPGSYGPGTLPIYPG